MEPPQGKTLLPELTIRQRNLLLFLQQGLDNQSIAQEMELSVKTVENQLTRLYRQLNVKSRLEAVNYILRIPTILGNPNLSAGSYKTTIGSSLQKPVAILVVDDNLRYRKQLQKMIAKLCPRATIYEAENIKSAIHIAQRIEMHLAMIDVVLGDEDGIACVRLIKAICPKCRLVLISAYPDREFHREGLQSGAVAFLDKKDLNVPTLRQVIDDVTV